MVNNVTCPVCGKQCTPKPTPGPDMRCPSCFSVFSIKPAAVSPLLARSAATTPAPALPPVNRTILAQPEAMIRYCCPRCKKSLESPASFAGQKLHCPECNQRLQIPQPPTPPPQPPINKTILAKEEPAVSPASRPSPSAPEPSVTPVDKVELLEEVTESVDQTAPSRRESCLECGVDITRRAQVQTCPDCGSLFCSAACYREHHYHSHAQKQEKRSRPVQCRFCGSTAPPYRFTQISQAGWITFAILLPFWILLTLLFCFPVLFPIFLIGLLMTETKWKCADCRAWLD